MAKHAYTMPADRVAGALNLRLISEMLSGLSISLMLALALFGIMKPDPFMSRHAPRQMETVQ
ncbi:hypothetical protein AD945_04015 [Gluconobacter albidus]|uniref:Uncharacterized protein n=1 Tax=Gluconobacter albidus TaxID=318683 RepID=A0A149TLG6_9PROT|nr:hypothetical protein [Gluconobacter albidus]KXV49598.1 hypothetical protein AD945_04015 [Gluconobacter albidus]